MKTLLLVTALVFAGTVPAFAQSMAPAPSLNAKIAADFGTHFSNGRATTIMKDGMVMTKITVPAAEMAMIMKMMKDGDDTCMIDEVSPGETNTVVLVCGAQK
jgi:hypothetical protein